MINLTNSEYQFSFYKNLYTTGAPDAAFDINELIEIIKYGYLKDEITRLRAAKDKEAYNKIKQSELPLVTLSGIFSERGNKNLVEHSGLIQIDIDKVQNYEEAWGKIIADEYTYVAFRSPGGKGIKAIVKINPDESTHLEQFWALEQYYKNEFDIEIDKACKDVSRCMLLSYDPDIYCNPFSEVFAECFVSNVLEEPKEKYNSTNLNLSSTDEEAIINQITTEIERNSLDITNGYENWIKIGYAISSVLGDPGRDYFHRISQFHNDYNSTKCDRQYTNLNRRNNDSIGLGTLIYYAKQHNIEISFPKEVQLTQKKPVKYKLVKKFNTEGKSLFDLLKEKRTKLAKKEQVPAYVILSDSILKKMCEHLPESKEAFLELKGVGAKRVEKYAQHFLPVISKYKGVDAHIDEAGAKSIICIPRGDQSKRLLLGQKGTAELLAIALNPSTANEEKLDPTSRNVKTIANNNGCDGWYMVNLYAGRTSKPEYLPIEPEKQLLQENESFIEEMFKSSDYNISKVLLCWGNEVESHVYLKESAQRILRILKTTGVKCYYMKMTGRKNPYHPAPTPVNRWLGGIDKVTLNKFVFE